MKRFRVISIALAALLLPGCMFFQQPENPSRAVRTGGLSVSVSQDANGTRTMVPDVTSAANRFERFEVTLTSDDGYPALSASDSDGAPWSVSFPEVREGSWDIAVSVGRGGSTVGTGSVLNQSITSDATSDVSVAIDYPATGAINLVLSFPASTGIDYVSGDLVGSGLGPMAPLVNTAGDPRTVSFTGSGVASGSYPLVLTFRRGGAGGTVGGVFREMVVVKGGFTSDGWVAQSGAIEPVRAYAATDFFETNANLAGLVLAFESGSVDLSGSIAAGTPYTLGPLSLTARTVRITATRSIPGQYLQYSLNGAPMTALRSGTQTTDITLAHSNTLNVRVTAPDGQNVKTCTVAFRLREPVSYEANSATGGTVPAASTFYDEGDTVPAADNTGSLVRTNYVWTGWNEAPDGSGAAHPGGSSFIMGNTPVTLYARWIPVHSLTVTFSIANPAYPVITFSDANPAVQRGNSIAFSTSITGGTLWNWRVNDTDMNVHTPAFEWDTSGYIPGTTDRWTPGQYIVNVDAVYGGYPCSGSVRVTVFK